MSQFGCIRGAGRAREMRSDFYLEKQKVNGTRPKWYKFKDTFAGDFEKCELRDLGKTLLEYSLKGLLMKETNNIFKKYHNVLAKEVVDIEEGRFQPKFIKIVASRIMLRNSFAVSLSDTIRREILIEERRDQQTV